MALSAGESATQGYLGIINGCTGVAYTAPQTLVTNNASQSKIVTLCHFFNFHSSAVTVNFYILPNSSGAVRTPASEDEYKFFEESIAALDYFVWDVPAYLAATNDTIRIYASVTAVINAIAWGYEKT